MRSEKRIGRRSIDLWRLAQRALPAPMSARVPHFLSSQSTQSSLNAIQLHCLEATNDSLSRYTCHVVMVQVLSRRGKRTRIAQATELRARLGIRSASAWSVLSVIERLRPRFELNRLHSFEISQRRESGAVALRNGFGCGPWLCWMRSAKKVCQTRLG